MLRRIVLGVLLSSSPAPPLASEELCTCADVTFQWRGCDPDGACDPGAWVGCTPSSDDGYAIDAACHVTVDGDDVLLTQESPHLWQIREGGSLVVRGPGKLALGPVGLVAEPGSRVELSGCFRRYAGNGDECASTLDSEALFPSGRVIPCRDLECSDDADRVRLDWSEAPADLAARIDDLLARVDPERDALCFWQRTEARWIGADAGYCYRIVGVAAGDGARHLDFDIRQVWQTQSDQAGYPLERRQVHVATLASDAHAGARTLAFEETGLAVGRSGPFGRFLRCDGEQLSYLIASASDEPGGDSVLLADARGLEKEYPAGTVCHVDWGWTQWDSAFVLAPLHVTAYDPAPDRSQLALEGETMLRGVVIDGLGGRETAGLGAAVFVRGGPLTAFEHVWVVDPLATNAAAVLLDDLPCGAQVRHLTVTGGPADPAHDANYGLAWLGGRECGYRLEHLYTRYTGDDVFVLESTGADPVGSIDLRYVQAGPSSLPGDSGQLFDFGAPNPTHVTVRDALCTACTSDDGFGALIGTNAGRGRIENLLWVGVRNGGLVATPDGAADHDFEFQRFGVIGSMIDEANSFGTGPLAGFRADRFYVRDVSDPRSNANVLCSTWLVGSTAQRLSRGVFARIGLGSTPCTMRTGSLADLYFLDVQRTASGPLLRVADDAGEVDLSRVTVGFTKPPSGISVGVMATSEQAARALRLDGLLLTGLRSPGSSRAMHLESASLAALVDWGAPTCFHDNDQDEDPAVLPAYGVAPVRGVDPSFVDPERWRFDLAPESPLRAIGCGGGEAGYAEVDWAHRKAKLAPMFMGPRPKGCGLGAELALALPLLARGMARLSRGSRAA